MNFDNILQPDGINKVYFSNGTNNDIINVFLKEYNKAIIQGIALAPIFQKNNFENSCFAVWNFVKYNIVYRVDKEGTQTIQLPSHLLNVSKKGDCKSKTLLCCAIISNFNFNGKKPQITIRFVNYEDTPSFTHVYLIAEINNKKIIVDTVWRYFNSEKLYFRKKDFKMKINSISGINEVYQEDIGKLFKKKKKSTSSSNSSNAETKKEKRKKKREERKEKRKEKRKKGKGFFNTVKKVSLAGPRGSFIALVNLNVRGLANKLLLSPKDKVEKIWKALGGNPSKLYKAVLLGSKKSPFLGAKAEYKTVDGIGSVVAVGTLLASAATVLAALAPVFKMIDKNKGAKDGESTEEILKETEKNGGILEIPEGEVSDPEEGSGKKPTFTSSFDLKKPANLLLIGGGVYILAKSLKIIK